MYNLYNLCVVIVTLAEIKRRMAEELLDACWEGDFRRAEILAGAGWAEEGEGDFVGVKDVRDWLGRTPLHLACRSGQLGESYNRLLSYASLRLFRPLLGGCLVTKC